MKHRKRLVALLLLSVLVVAGVLLTSMVAVADDAAPTRGKVVIANRGSGTISVIDALTDQVVGTYALPAGPNPPEPMYVVYVPAKHRVLVGDRANDRVVAFDARDFSVEGTVDAGAGVFHMWADPQSKQLWVNNDVDKTTTVIDPKRLTVLGEVPTPADLVAVGGKSHDVILDPMGRYAYVTVLGLPGPHDYVVQFSTSTFEELGRAAVGKDPHLALARQNDLLYVPSQNSDVVVVLDRETLEPVTEIAVPGAHGAGMARNGKVLYTTNLPGGGPDGLYAIDTRSNSVIGTGGVDTPYPIPHNIALNASGRKVYVTHSGGTADKVTVYTTTADDARPAFAGEVTVGLNPFGLAFVP